MSPTSLPAWTDLRTHRTELDDLRLTDLFEADTTRGPAMTVEHDGVVLDYSKNLVTSKTIELLMRLATNDR